MALFGKVTSDVITPERALPGRSEPLSVPEFHAVFPDRRITEPFPPGLAKAVFGMGCFWGAERLFWQQHGVYSTAVGYAAGHTPNPTYEEVCSGLTGHTEVVLVVFDPTKISYEQLLTLFWEGHNPTEGMRQGADIGTQYRSAILYLNEDQRLAAEQSRDRYQQALSTSGYGRITTEIAALSAFYLAEGYHQQYLSEGKNPNGYCGVGGTGVSCPVGLNIDK